MEATIEGRLCGSLLMLFGDVMSQSNTTVRLSLLLYTGLVLLIVRYLTNEHRKMESAEVITDVELFLKASRLQDLILPEQQKIIDELASVWNNSAYRGDIRKVSLGEWLRESRINISSP